MHSFEVSGGTADEFVRKLSRALVDRGLAEYVEVHLVGDEMVARLRWLGTTELRYRVIPRDEGFLAELGRKRVSPLHAPFRAGFDERFEQVLSELGATLV
jgi:hypothetical protein